VLAERFERVVVVERDPLPQIGEHRRGVPHGRHLHGLHPLGREILDELFPGFTETLIADGAVGCDILGDLRWQLSGHRLQQAATGLPALFASRPFLEGHVRAMVRRLPAVRVLEQRSICGLTTTPDRKTITGAEIRPAGGGEPERIAASLVVDATGRGSRTPVWLGELGYPQPAQDRVEISLGYATRTYRLRPDAMTGDQMILTAATPANPRTGVLAVTEGGRHMLTIAGIRGDHPPTDPAGFDAFVDALPTADISTAITGAQPLDNPVPFRFPASVRHRYERLPRLSGPAAGDRRCHLLLQPGLRAGHHRSRSAGHDPAPPAHPARRARRPALLPCHRRRHRCAMGHRGQRRPGVPPGTRPAPGEGAADQRLPPEAAPRCRP
jgi:hypothetical protein